VSVRYAEELNSGKSSVIFQREAPGVVVVRNCRRLVLVNPLGGGRVSMASLSTFHIFPLYWEISWAVHHHPDCEAFYTGNEFITALIICLFQRQPTGSRFVSVEPLETP
jgi:hypothetical protein